MEKRRNWLIEINLSLGNSLCDLSTLTDEHLNQLNNLIKNLQKHVDFDDSKLFPFLCKFYLNKKFYGKAWKLINKQIEDKAFSQQKDYDLKLLQVISTVLSLSLSQYLVLALSIDEFEIFSYISRTFNCC